MVSPQRRIPQLVPEVNVRTLPLTAVDGFVISRVDGRCSVAEIAASTGLAQDTVSEIVDRLRALGALRYHDEPPAAAARAAAHQGFTNGRASAPRQPSEASARERGGMPTTSGRGQSQFSRASQPPRASDSAYSSRPPSGAQGRASEDPGTGSFGALPTGTMPARPGSAGASRSARSLPAGAGVHGGATASRQAERTRAAVAPLPPEQGTNPRVIIGERSGVAGDGARVDARAETQEAHKGPRGRGEPVRTQSDLFPMHGSAEMPAPAKQEEAAPALYDPRELDEEVDLPYARRKQLLDLYYRLGEIDYYEALQVLYTADKKEIRSAYFAFSKVFHPDSMFRKNLGSFKPKMEAVFNFLTEGYEILSKKKQREEYDAYVRVTKAARLAEQTLEQAAIAREEAARPKPPPPEPPAPPARRPPPPPVPPPREVSAEARKLAHDVVARRIKSATQGRAPVRSVVPPPISVVAPEPLAPPAPPPRDAQELLRRLTRTLKDVGQLTGTADVVGRAVKAAHAAIAKGDFAEGAQLLSKALAVEPEREDLRAEFDRVSQQLAGKLADDYAEQAKFESKSGKWASASLSWSKVCAGKPDDAPAHRHAAHALLKAGNDLRGAQKYGEKAVALAPSDLEGRLLLTSIYMTIGLKLNARRELEAAAKLDPDSEIVKNLMADLAKA